MKLENVNVEKLQLSDLPKFNKCPCELCDDGCFDKAGNKHYPGCQRRQPQKSKLPLVARCPLSNYKGTFLAATSAPSRSADHRRHPCLPPPDNEIPISFRNFPMSGISSQKEHYQPPPSGIIKQKSAAPAKQADHVLFARAVPMETQTHYQAEYPEKPVIPISLRSGKAPTKESQINITEPSAHIASQTTTRAHFKSWQSPPSQPFTEMPAVAGHVLFPGSNRDFDTTTGSAFIPYRNISVAKPVVRLEQNGNLYAAGSMDLHTNYRRDYMTPELPSTSSSADGKREIEHEQKVYTRRPMNGISQTSFDFRPYSKPRRTPSINMEPFLSQISIGSTYKPVERDSQYRLDYPGYDTKQFPRQVGAAPKDHQRAYQAPVQKMDTQTTSQRDFQPVDINSLPRIQMVPLKSTLSITDQTSPMENMTMSRYHYQPYEHTSSTRRYGEVIPNMYIPPMDKFQGTTTTGETYQGRSGQPARTFIPEVKMVNQIGEHDHRTNYRLDYPPHGLSLCAAKAFTIAQNKETTATPIPAQ